MIYIKTKLTHILCDVLLFPSVVWSSSPPLIRLANGSGSYEGRLEVFFQGEWGTVCLPEELDYGKMPQTVCNQIGAGNWKASLTRKFGPGVGRIWLEGIRCNGDEDGIDSCKYPAWGAVTCDHSMDIGVKCGGL